MSGLILALKESPQPRIIIVLILLLHYIPTSLWGLNILAVTICTYWFIYKYCKQGTLPQELEKLLQIIQKDHHTSLTLSMRLSPTGVLDFATQQYIYQSETYDIKYQGHESHRLLELGPLALSGQSHNQLFFKNLLSHIPTTRFQQLIVVVDESILQRHLPVQGLSEFFQCLNARFKKIPYDIYINSLVMQNAQKTFTIFDLSKQSETSQYCQLLREHVEQTISQLAQTPTNNTPRHIVRWDRVIEPIQSLIQHIHQAAAFDLQYICVTSKPIPWASHLAPIKNHQPTMMWTTMITLVCLIGAALWQWQESLLTLESIKTSINQQHQEIKERKKAIAPHYSLKDLLIHATYYAGLTDLSDSGFVPKWSVDTVKNQLASRTQHDIDTWLDMEHPAPVIQQVIKFSDFADVESKFSFTANDYCLWHAWASDNQPLAHCLKEHTAHIEKQWLNLQITQILRQITPVLDHTDPLKLSQSLQDHIQHPEPSTAVHTQLPILIHLASKHHDQQTLSKISQLSEYLSHIHHSRTHALIQYMHEDLQGKTHTSEIPEALNSIDHELSAPIAQAREKLIDQLTWQRIHTAYKTDVWPSYTKLKSCYPFQQTSPQDCSLQLLQDFFGVHGILDTFIEKHLASHIKETEQGLAWTVTPPQADENFLNQLMLAKVIQKTMFNPQGKVSMKATLRPQYLPASTHLKIAYGGTIHELSQARPHEVNLQIEPYSQQIFSVTSGSQTPEIYRTPWGFYRWVQSHLHDDQNNQLTLSILTDKQQMLLSLRHHSPLNLWHPSTLSSFNLPEKVCAYS